MLAPLMLTIKVQLPRHLHRFPTPLGAERNGCPDHKVAPAQAPHGKGRLAQDHDGAARAEAWVQPDGHVVDQLALLLCSWEGSQLKHSTNGAATLAQRTLVARISRTHAVHFHEECPVVDVDAACLQGQHVEVHGAFAQQGEKGTARRYTSHPWRHDAVQVADIQRAQLPLPSSLPRSLLQRWGGGQRKAAGAPVAEQGTLPEQPSSRTSKTSWLRCAYSAGYSCRACCLSPTDGTASSKQKGRLHQPTGKVRQWSGAWTMHDLLPAEQKGRPACTWDTRRLAPAAPHCRRWAAACQTGGTGRRRRRCGGRAFRGARGKVSGTRRTAALHVARPGRHQAGVGPPRCASSAQQKRCEQAGHLPRLVSWLRCCRGMPPVCPTGMQPWSQVSALGT